MSVQQAGCLLLDTSVDCPVSINIFYYPFTARTKRMMRPQTIYKKNVPSYHQITKNTRQKLTF